MSAEYRENFTELDWLYLELLQYGVMHLRNDSRSLSQEVIDEELQLYHNIPSLIGSEHWQSHIYYWEKERTWYLKRLELLGVDDDYWSFVRTHLLRIFEDMEPLIAQIPRS